KINDPFNNPPPPYKLINNQYSPLNVTDVVITNAIGTGFSRAIGKKKNSYFWGQRHDISSISNFIKTYLMKNGRINSPKYLFGESYGSFRSAGIANYLMRQGIVLNGVIML